MERTVIERDLAQFGVSESSGVMRRFWAMADLKLDQLLVVVPGKESYDLGPRVEVVSILHLVERLGRMARELKA